MNLQKQELKSAKVTIQSGQLVVEVKGQDVEKMKTLLGFESEKLQLTVSGFADGSTDNHGFDGIRYHIVNVFQLALSS